MPWGKQNGVGTRRCRLVSSGEQHRVEIGKLVMAGHEHPCFGGACILVEGLVEADEKERSAAVIVVAMMLFSLFLRSLFLFLLLPLSLLLSSSWSVVSCFFACARIMN